MIINLKILWFNRNHRNDDYLHVNKTLFPISILENLFKKIPKYDILIKCKINSDSNSESRDKIIRPLISQKLLNPEKISQSMRCYTYFSRRLSSYKNHFLRENTKMI
jgi:hypothetical protein